jgi:hypothetical protein
MSFPCRAARRSRISLRTAASAAALVSKFSGSWSQWSPSALRTCQSRGPAPRKPLSYRHLRVRITYSQGCKHETQNRRGSPKGARWQRAMHRKMRDRVASHRLRVPCVALRRIPSPKGSRVNTQPVSNVEEQPTGKYQTKVAILEAPR